MSDTILYEEVAALAEKLSPEEKLKLVAHLLTRANENYQPKPGRKWAEIRGMVQYPYLGEDAQAYISRSRREDSEHRDAMLRGNPPCE